MKDFDLRDLDAFVAVARTRNFRRAATEQGVSVSSISQRIRDMEERLGVRLMNRTTRSVALTEAGIPAPWSAVIVGGGLAIVAFLMAKKGIDNLKAGRLAPERTTRAAARDVSMVKEKI